MSLKQGYGSYGGTRKQQSANRLSTAGQLRMA